MGSKIASFLATLLLSIPLAGIGLMAIFGVPQVVPASNSTDQPNLLKSVQDRFSNWNQTPAAGDSTFAQSPSYEDAVVLGQSHPIQGTESGRAMGSPWDEKPNTSSFSGSDIQSANANQSQRLANEPMSLGESRSDFQSKGSNNRSRFDDSFPSRSASNNEQNSRSQQHALRDSSSRFGGAQESNSESNVFSRNEQNSQHRFVDQPESLSQQQKQFSTPPAFNSSSLSGKSLTWKQASLKLADMGIKEYHLEPADQEGHFLFVCLYSSADAPQVIHRFEEESDDPLDAVNRVLNKLDSFMQDQFAQSKFPNRNQNFSLSATSR